ncbi:DsbA family oxidoreductase [Knoellia sp. LjRoot47]|uniref:DsbA family oxidoreductase n=1 Tax=Knoellia sp. LjRoot47 TaxID=3342330 RepID=UPI003ECD1563
MNVDIWSDIACPWCFIGKRRFESALAGFAHADEVEVTWHSYQLDPSLPDHYDGTELDYLAGRKGMAREQVSEMFEHVAATAAQEGLDYDFERLVVANSRTAHELLHLAKEHGVADAVKEALLSAHFEHGEDIGDRDTLVRIGVAAGLDATVTIEALQTHRYADAVQADISEAHSLGIQGVPFFVIDRTYGVSGAQPVELFTQALTQAWSEAHPLTMVTSTGDRTGSADDVACGPDGCAV